MLDVAHTAGGMALIGLLILVALRHVFGSVNVAIR